MKLLLLCTFGFLVCLAGTGAFAQGKPPGGPPAGGRGPGGSAGPGGPGASGAPGGDTAPAAARVAGESAGSVPHFGPVGRWWDDKAVIQSVGLSKEQQKRMDVVFDANKAPILAAYKTYLAEQAKLNTLSKQPQVDQASLFAAIDQVSQARTTLQKANTQMLLQIRQQMEQSQIDKLEKLR